MCVSCSFGFVAFIAAAFLMGSIPFGVVLARAFGLPDPRTIGSKNIGATNMLRTGRKDVAALTLLLDAAKGAAAVLMATQLLQTDMLTAAVAALAAVLGHMYSPWLDYKGGKGVATTVGATLALSLPLGAITCGIWLAVFIVTRISSLSAIIAFTAMPILAYRMFDMNTALALAAIAAWVIYRHEANIKRLLKGKEPTFSSKKARKS